MKASATALDDFIMEYRLKVGEAIKKTREKRGHSQDELAELMNISRSTISKVENGKFAMSVDYLAKFGWYLKFDINLIQNPTKK
jgi:transcriptional regulator with XRE-family HTH domain